MNSSSAFSNALSAIPAQPAANAQPAKNSPQRNLSDDSKVGFKKALDELRSEQHSQQDIKQKNTCTKKSVAADKQPKVKSDDPAAPAATSEKVTARSASNVIGENTTSSPDDAVKSEDMHEAPLTVEMALQAPATQAAIIGDIAGDVALNTDSSSLITDTDIPDVASAATQSIALIEGVEATAEIKATDEVALITVLDQESPRDAAAPVAVALTTPVAAALSDADTAVASVVAGLGLLKDSEVKTDKSAVIMDSSAADASLLSDDKPAATDPKAVFEKMLQAMTGNAGAIGNTGANSNAGSEPQKAQDLAAAIATATPASSASATPAIESLLRSADTLPTARSFVVQTAVPVTLGQPQWSQAVGEKVLWLAAQNVHSAEIRLDPPELGPMMVKISVNQEQTSVSFTSHHAGVREVLDQSLGRLRDMFNEQGLNLANVDVSDKSFQRHQGEGSEQHGQSSHSEQQEQETAIAVSAIVQQRLVDHYA